MNCPKRPCYYCGLLQSQIARHLKRKHKDEDLIQTAINGGKKRHDEIIDHVRKLGMDKYNKIELGKEKPCIQRERRPTKNNEEDVVMCSKCHGVYQRQSYSRHKSVCAGDSLPPTALDLDHVKVKLNLSSIFKKEILGTLRHDMIGKIVWSDQWILIIGSYMHHKIKRKVDKAMEVRSSLNYSFLH